MRPTGPRLPRRGHAAGVSDHRVIRCAHGGAWLPGRGERPSGTARFPARENTRGAKRVFASGYEDRSWPKAEFRGPSSEARVRVAASGSWPRPDSHASATTRLRTCVGVWHSPGARGRGAPPGGTECVRETRSGPGLRRGLFETAGAFTANGRRLVVFVHAQDPEGLVDVHAAAEVTARGRGWRVGAAFAFVAAANPAAADAADW